MASQDIYIYLSFAGNQPPEIAAPTVFVIRTDEPTENFITISDDSDKPTDIKITHNTSSINDFNFTKLSKEISSTC